jgi:hypothetical protein
MFAPGEPRGLRQREIPLSAAERLSSSANIPGESEIRDARPNISASARSSPKLVSISV